MFSSIKPVAASSDYSILGNTQCQCSVQTAQAVPERCPQELGHWFCSHSLQFSSGMAFWSNYQIHDQQVGKVLSALKSKNNLCEVRSWNSFGSVENEEIEDSSSRRHWVDTNPHPPDSGRLSERARIGQLYNYIICLLGWTRNKYKALSSMRCAKMNCNSNILPLLLWRTRRRMY